MKDVSHKSMTLRTAVASCSVSMSPSAVEAIQSGNAPKGDPREVARTAAIQAAKATWQIIPYCHPIPVDHVRVDFQMEDAKIQITAAVKAVYKTGVEMEAMTAASVAALTIYDMLKPIDESLVIGEVRLCSKQGGKSDFDERKYRNCKAGVLVMSDSISAGSKEDRSGKQICERLRDSGVAVEQYEIIPDDAEAIRELVCRWCDDLQLDLIITTGGTGISPRDCTPEAMDGVFDKELPGIAEAMRSYGQLRTPYSMLSRSLAGVRERSVILNLPGSTKGVAESLDAVFPAVLHAFKMIDGGRHDEKLNLNSVSS